MKPGEAGHIRWEMAGRLIKNVCQKNREPNFGKGRGRGKIGVITVVALGKTRTLEKTTIPSIVTRG